MRVNITWQRAVLAAAILLTAGLIAYMIVAYTTGDTVGGDNAGAGLLIFLMVALPTWVAHRIGRGGKAKVTAPPVQQIRDEIRAQNSDVHEAVQALHQMRVALGRDIPAMHAKLDRVQSTVDTHAQELDAMRPAVERTAQMYDMVAAIHDRTGGDADVRPFRRSNGDR